MLFSSFEFLLVFLPLAVLGYFAAARVLPRWGAFGVLALASLAFYGYWDWRYLFLLVPSIAANYTLGRVLAARGSPRVKRAILIAGISLNIVLIAVFKYADFVAGTLSSIFGFEHEPWRIVLPLGISFFTFQQVAYLVDCAREEQPERSIVNYTLFVTFFAQLIAGPIVHHKSMLPQFRLAGAVRPSASRISAGLMWLSFGLFKKVVVADTLSPWVAAAFDGTGDIGTEGAWAGAIAYTLQIYFDFSGYSDMAIGLGMLFNIRLPENFNSPYKATSIVDFWRRWHMTLSAFLRDYVYIPLGGNRSGPSRRYVNLLLTMLIGGLWHGSAWTFVVWGALHGIYLCINHAWSRFGFGLPKPIAWMCTILSVIVAWVLFRAVPVGDDGGFERAIEILAAMVGFGSETSRFEPESWQWGTMLAAGLWCVVAPNTSRFLTSKPQGVATGLIAAGAFIAAMLLLRETITADGRVTEFIYFQF
ncbi:MAG: MBOAT family protein [Planctomycetota bacterium]